MSTNLSVFLLTLQLLCTLDCSLGVKCYTCFERQDWGEDNVYENCISGGPPISKPDPDYPDVPPGDTEETCADGEICFIIKVIDNDDTNVFVEKRCGNPEDLKCPQATLGQTGDCLIANFEERQKIEEACQKRSLIGEDENDLLRRKRQDSGGEVEDSQRSTPNLCFVVLSCGTDYCNKDIWKCESGGTGCAQ